MTLLSESQGRFIDEVSRLEDLRNRMMEREQFFMGRSATEHIFDSVAIKMERPLAESFKAVKYAQSLQGMIQQQYSAGALEQMNRVAKVVTEFQSAHIQQALKPQHLSEVAEAVNAFQQSEWRWMTQAAKTSMSILSDVPILRNSEYEEEQLRKSAEILRKVEANLEKLPPELQDTFWDSPLEEIPLSIVLDTNLTDEQRAIELATFFAGGEVESSWLQIRRILYPAINGHVAPLVTLFGILATVSAAKGYYSAFCHFISWAFIFWAVDVEGEPTEEEFPS